MSDPQPRYALAQAEGTSELERLRMLESMRPGGIVLIEEPDYGAMEPCDHEHPGTGVFVQFRDGLLNGDAMDAFAARKVFR